jgi:hypothetical protein
MHDNNFDNNNDQPYSGNMKFLGKTGGDNRVNYMLGMTEDEF